MFYSLVPVAITFPAYQTLFLSDFFLGLPPVLFFNDLRVCLREFSEL